MTLLCKNKALSHGKKKFLFTFKKLNVTACDPTYR